MATSFRTGPADDRNGPSTIKPGNDDQRNGYMAQFALQKFCTVDANSVRPSARDPPTCQTRCQPSTSPPDAPARSRLRPPSATVACNGRPWPSSPRPSVRSCWQARWRRPWSASALFQTDSAGYPPVRRSSMLLAASSQTAAKSRSSCLPTFSVFSASCRYIAASCRDNHPNPCMPLCVSPSPDGPGR